MIEREDLLKFTNLIILLSKLLAKIEDKFFIQKLHKRIFDIMSTFLLYGKEVNTVSHNVNKLKLLETIDDLLDCLEYLKHDFKSDATPLFLTQRNLLKFKLYILKQKQVKGAADSESIPHNIDSSLSLMHNDRKRNFLKAKSRHTFLKNDSNKEKILNFIKKFPDARTKEIIDKFNTLSVRTVKRNLKELIDEGFLNKKSEKGAVYYLAAD